MTIFSNLEAARRYGFVWLEFQAGIGLHLVARDYTRGDGRRCRALAFARPAEVDEPAQL